ncbi:MAG: Gfo/Idh/MocA family oxidoreductase [Defluviitaleaceae bacterium]|nr:Gfo/Idh/MocA family oxidoreductase [Defluviitaleaceae bacterium]
MSKLRIAALGAGYWAQFQIAAWQAEGAEIVAAWNRTKRRAEETAARFGIPRVFDTPRQLFEWGEFDIADIIADAGAHEELVLMAAEHGKDVICQKPMSTTLASCEKMAEACRKAGVWYAVHENFRYQPQIMKAAEILASGVIGRPVQAHLQLRSPDRSIMEKQPALKTMDHMALRDMGPHIFDVARMLFGEAKAIYSRPVRCYPDIPVDDAAKSILRMESGLVISCDLAHNFAYKLFVEGERGTLRLNADNTIEADNGQDSRQIDVGQWPALDYIPADDWATHGWFVFTAIPLCLRSLTERYMRGLPAETSGEDNLKTMRLVFAAMESQDGDRVVEI